MSITVPTRTDLDFYQIQLTLDGVAFDLVFRWNQRDETWFLSIYDPDVAEEVDGSRLPIMGSIPVLTGTPLLGLHQARNRPLGELLAVDTQGQDADPGRRDLGDRVVLLYYTNAELAEVLDV